jgi:hypothetical protein
MKMNPIIISIALMLLISSAAAESWECSYGTRQGSEVRNCVLVRSPEPCTMENRACRILAARQAIVSAFEHVFNLTSGPGEARLGQARRGMARPGVAGLGEAGEFSNSLAFTLTK